ncbi:MAG TPA: fibronectin type III domain-containing protein, partial [Thermoanaerobaculia bacterium]|nr:fibronectin type III domain-containing protein [Thermoanaerobaculia bacterium]
GSLWRTMRAVDDDDGNLGNGTPHSAALYAAFNRHGIACTTDPGASTSFRGCTQPAVPTLTLTAGNNMVTVSWSSVGPGIAYDVYRNEAGCNAGFTKITNDVSGTSFADSAVADGFTYYYQVVAHPSANEACHAAPTPCQSVTLGCTPATPTGLTATAVSASQVQLYWSAGGGNADHYEIQRAQTHGGPFSTVTSNVSGTSFTDTTALGDSTYIYRVRAVCSGNYSNFSSTDIATTVIFIDDPLVPGVLIKAEHMGQLRRGVDAMRVAAQLQPVNWSDPGLLGVPVKATHIQELRSNLDAALAILGRPVPQYTDHSLVLNVTPIKAVHWQEIRDRVK